MAKQEEGLNAAQRQFCEEYIFDWNASRAYKVAYPSKKDENVITSAASRLLTNVKVEAYIKELQEDLERLAGISRLSVLKEHKKLAYSSIAHLHNTWIERKAFDKLTPEQKDCIAEISTQIKTNRNADGTLEENEYIKVKLYDKQKALDSISKMLGYNAPEKMDHTINDQRKEIDQLFPKKIG